MARIFITGSAEGLGLLSGRFLAARGHEVVLHARNPAREAHIRTVCPEAAGVVTGDLEKMDGMRQVAADAAAQGPFDAVIHNAGVGDKGTGWQTIDGVPLVFAVNVLAPYVLTALMPPPARLIYLSSGMHYGARPMDLDAAVSDGFWTLPVSYSQSKFLVTLLAFVVARRWPAVASNAVDPGWVPTRMGGPSAPDDLQLGCETQSWLAEGGEVTGEYFHHRKVRRPEPATRNFVMQDQLLALCARLSGVEFPG